ncbi:uncharacterized protein C8Q71DRAFT_269661 [Rhodofomes roseus]|uniref:Uncharacterized protein n=1 Tax=Rhodofomes roseus TaxID=34475 RepID=A0ABQ8K5N7_9APHY|nr:uncharacterized protein C8Q71DRAFT_269661 [Rhodofomes roseus]KAH9832273.1 hypothetical protein C8Q71DRAFT_269661 [Rhodofomes roseus]
MRTTICHGQPWIAVHTQPAILHHCGHTRIFELRKPLRTSVPPGNLYGLRILSKNAANMMRFSRFQRVFGEHATNMNTVGAFSDKQLPYRVASWWVQSAHWSNVERREAWHTVHKNIRRQAVPAVKSACLQCPQWYTKMIVPSNDVQRTPTGAPGNLDYSLELGCTLRCSAVGSLALDAVLHTAVRCLRYSTTQYCQQHVR